MTQEELNYIKDSFSQIIDDIAGNPEWYEAARAIASELGSLERELEKKVVKLPSGLNETADAYAEQHGFRVPYDGTNSFYDEVDVKASKDGFKAGAKWMAEQLKK